MRSRAKVHVNSTVRIDFVEVRAKAVCSLWLGVENPVVGMHEIGGQSGRRRLVRNHNGLCRPHDEAE